MGRQPLGAGSKDVEVIDNLVIPGRKLPGGKIPGKKIPEEEWMKVH